MHTPDKLKYFIDRCERSIKLLNRYLDCWDDNNCGLSPGYLLVSILEARSDIGHILRYLEISGSYQEILKGLRSRAHLAFEKLRHILTDTKGIANALEWVKVSESEEILESFLSLHEDIQAYELENNEEVNERIRDIASEYLHTFFEEKVFVIELISLLGERQANCKDFLRGLSRTEERFRTYFHYWASLQDVLKDFRESIHATELFQDERETYWWLFENPSAEELAKETSDRQAIAEKLIDLISSDSIAEAIRQRVPGAEDHPEDIVLAGYAAGELPIRSGRVKAHLLVCEKCAKDVVFFKDAMGQVVGPPTETVPIPSAVNDFLNKTIDKIEPLQKIYRELQALGLPLTMPDPAQLQSQLKGMIDLSHVLPLVRPEEELLPMAAEPEEARKTEHVLANRAEVVSGELRGLDFVQVKICDWFYEDGVLSVYMEIPEGLRHDRYIWNCCWEKKDGQIVWPDPGTLRVDPDTGFLSAKFGLADGPDPGDVIRMLRLSILDEIET